MGSKFSEKALHEVMTATKAIVKRSRLIRTVQQACTGYHGGKPRFASMKARKTGRIRLVTRTGMEQVYGSMPNT